MNESELKPFWRKFFRFNWKFGLLLVLVVCSIRFMLVLRANVNGNYGAIGMVMFISALVPFIFLTRYGRKSIGLKKAENYAWIFYGLFLGLAFSFVLYFLGQMLYGNHYENWYQYIGRSYNIPAGINAADKKIMFAIVSLTGVTFSPIGEELFFRGIVHSSFANSIGETRASVVDSTAFALTHISHFGLVFIDQKWKFLPVPTLIWVFSMFLASIFFYLCRKYSGSLLGSIVCHAAFNLGMIYCIFYLL